MAKLLERFIARKRSLEFIGPRGSGWNLLAFLALHAKMYSAADIIKLTQCPRKLWQPVDTEIIFNSGGWHPVTPFWANTHRVPGRGDDNFFDHPLYYESILLPLVFDVTWTRAKVIFTGCPEIEEWPSNRRDLRATWGEHSRCPASPRGFLTRPKRRGRAARRQFALGFEGLKHVEMIQSYGSFQCRTFFAQDEYETFDDWDPSDDEFEDNRKIIVRSAAHGILYLRGLAHNPK
ncbi:hypothetical protein ACHAQH_006278 [Verticillium albo-atrum]